MLNIVTLDCWLPCLYFTSRYFREKCWLCEANFPDRKSLNVHLISSAHRRLSVMCVWCDGKENVYTRIADLESHVKKVHRKVAISMDQFTRENGFDFAKYPEDYAKVVENINPTNPRRLIKRKEESHNKLE
ncbi:hypothetical protein DPMN_147471 [Dreissena polymorpha]|uniref:C2H2-type domain-containing protein n=1 Tax=Dreissena polymorpha TaxID=45954 RepID=A0A9D4F8D9_DREPO|nr:hypothetical protein DPMN_147471 [Dreissena polymorpha]